MCVEKRWLRSPIEESGALHVGFSTLQAVHEELLLGSDGMFGTKE